MPLVRSREDLTAECPNDVTNASFVVEMRDTNFPNMTGPITRSRANRLDFNNTNTDNNINLVQEGEPGRSTEDTGNSSVDENRIMRIISESLQSFRTEITGEISSMLGNVNLPNNNESRHNAFPDAALYSGQARHMGQHRDAFRSENCEFSSINQNSEKVLNIIRNWRIKFSARPDDIDVEEFIYRVNILASNTLNGNFRLLCEHVYSLFEGKALDWFWRYHRQNNDITWLSLTNALRKQYKSEYTDFDTREDIRKRKQKVNEVFDDYLDAMLNLSDKLCTPMGDSELCETILRNLKPEIRHELLHVNITQISQLRREVRKHERFMNDMRLNNSSRNFMVKKQVAELDFDSGKDNGDEIEVDVCAVSKLLTCWNCSETGHTYKNCLKERTIFCYGCGIKDTYKPNCTNCKLQGNLKKDVLYQKRGHPNITRKN